jgi:predicted PolB exonuclease-like 3'-5' exonuclease
MNIFLKSSDLSLNPAGYLVATTENKPVTHVAFVEQQKRAHYVVSLSAAIKDKNFKPCKVDDLDAIAKQVQADIDATSVLNYVTAPVKPTSAVNDELIKFALDFAAYDDVKAQTDKINAFMQTFNSIRSVEEVGDYFQEGLVKLNKIYTIAEILEAVKINIAKMN